MYEVKYLPKFYCNYPRPVKVWYLTQVPVKGPVYSLEVAVCTHGTHELTSVVHVEIALSLHVLFDFS